GSKVSVYDGAAKLGEVDVDGNGNWSFTPGKALDDGPHSFTTKVTDPAGNESPSSTPVTVTVDTSKVEVSIGSLVDDQGAITGSIAPNGVTDDTRPEIQGTGKAGSTITVYDGTNVLGTTTVQPNGTWSFTPSVDLGQGAHSITAQAEDLTGTKSEATPAFVFRVDTVAPLAPTIGEVTDDVGEVQGALMNGATTDDPSPTLSGKAEAGSTVTVYDGGKPLGSVKAGANGDWSYTPTTGLNEGKHEFTVKATDAAGNTSAESDKFTLTTDYTAPDASKLAITGVEDDVGLVTGNVAPGATTDDSRPLIHGTGTAGDTIIVMVKDGVGSRELGRATVGADGKWSLQVQTALASGLNEFTAIEMDPAGNKTSPSNPYTVTFDDSVPATSIAITSITDDTGTSAHDFVTSDTSLTINGTLTQALASGQRAQITVDGGRSWQDVVVSGTSWSYVDSRTLSDGQYDYTVRVISAAGVAGSIDQKTVTIDTQSPTNKTTVDLAAESDWGLSNTDNITANVTPTINGKVGAGSDTDLSKLRVTLFDDVNNDGKLDAGDRVFSSSISVAADGSWSYDLPSLRDGSYRLKAVVTDQAGNASSTVSTLDGKGSSLVIDIDSIAQTIRGGAQLDQLGYDVTNIGDFNGDGYDDLMVSAPFADNRSGANGDNAGAAYILFGSAAGIPAIGNYLGSNTRDLKPEEGLKIFGAPRTEDRPDDMGRAINYLGDINGDGYDDVLIASHANDKAYVVFGGANGTWANGQLNLATIDRGQNQYGFKVALPVADDSAFTTGVGAADINGDGYADLLLGDPTNGSGDRGGAVVIYGHAGDWSNIQLVLANGRWTLPSGVHGTSIFGATSGTYTTRDLGWQINGVGDVNGDGIEDFVIADPSGSNPMMASNQPGGTNYLIYGSKDGLPATLDLSRLTPDQGIHINGMRGEALGGTVSLGSSGGNTIAALGDINGDGIGDFAIGTAHSDPGNPGRVWVIYGKQGGYGKDINLDAMFTSGNSARPSGYVPTFTAADGFLLVNEKSTATSQSTADENFGMTIRGMGDVNGDGINDFIIGAELADGDGKTDNGAAYVVYGRSENFEAPVISIKDIMNDPSKGYVLRGANEWGGWDRYGSGVAIGDWNGDGVADVAVGARYGDNIGATTSDNGALYIYYGTPNFTQEYTTGDDVLVGTGGVDFLAGGLGNDTISQIGTKDVALGGAGNDTIRIIGTDFMNVDGGVGIDTLVMDGKGMSLDLTALKSKVKGFEHFDLGSDGGNTLAVQMSDIARLGKTNVLVSDGKTQLVVHGDATGQVNLVNAGAAADRWTDAGTKTVDGSVYHAYTNVAGTSELLVEDRVHVTIL
ncbi:Ig-like domain-containing protein, partial [Variovorax sp. M-6]|uniref:Ig-like domain-containing protein n=1 Tax=Variovorax sp. M-6 TaxID=3233041 RepID=UPI003F97C2F1